MNYTYLTSDGNQYGIEVVDGKHILNQFTHARNETVSDWVRCADFDTMDDVVGALVEIENHIHRRFSPRPSCDELRKHITEKLGIYK